MDWPAAPPLRLALPRRSLRGASDERLVAQVRGRDRATARTAFEALYDRHHRGILAYCRHLLGSQEEAEDVVQHTFSSAYRAILLDNREIAVRAWLYAIARNRCLSVLAARREQIGLDSVEAVLPTTIGLAAEVQQRADLRELLADLQRLPEQQRSALVLSELEAHSHAEIAEILGVAPKKVKALVFQAREALMISRQAREADCTEVRSQLSVLRGSALRRRELRRHVESCAECCAFEIEVRRQRAGMALLLPVAPTLALKHGSLAAAFTAGGTGVAAGSAAMGGGTILTAGLMVGSKSVGAKALAALVVVAGTGGGGYVAVDEVTHESRSAPPAAKVQSATGAAAQAPRRVPVGALAAPAPGPAARPGASGVNEHAGTRPEGGGQAGKSGRGDRAPADRPQDGRPHTGTGATAQRPSQNSGQGAAGKQARPPEQAGGASGAPGANAAKSFAAASQKKQPGSGPGGRSGQPDRGGTSRPR